MSEAALWTWVRARLPPGAHVARIESETSPGIPDVYFRFDRSTCWMELKFLRKKKPPFGKKGLRKDQELWIREEMAHGGRVYIVAAVGQTVFFLDGSCARRFNLMTLDEIKASAVRTFAKREPQVEFWLKQLLTSNHPWV